VDVKTSDMKSKKSEVAKLEAELVRLNALVRARRQTLLRLQTCPHKTCECRLLWQSETEKTLALQVGKVRKVVINGASAKASPRDISAR
jgi:hypothetical protein